MTNYNPWRSTVPQVHIPRHPLWLDAYSGAWDLLWRKLEPGSALESPEDSALVLFARYAFQALPVSRWLDHGWQAAPSPLALWAEWALYQACGSRERLAELLPRFWIQFTTFRAEHRNASGLYRNRSGTGEPGIQAPREDGEWVDLSAQQALAAECLAKMARAVGQPENEQIYGAEWQQVREAINRLCWDPSLQFYLDRHAEGTPAPAKTSAGFWPLLAGVPSDQQARLLAKHLADPHEFWRVHVVPSLSADHPRYSDRGALWRGSVWPLTDYAIIKGLERYGLHGLALRAADNHITTISHVYKETRSLWNNYAPDYIEPGSIAQPDVATAGVSVVSLLLETILGFRIDAPANTLHWRPGLPETFTVERLRVGSVNVDVTVNAERDGRLRATLNCSAPLTLHLNTADGEQWLDIRDTLTTQFRPHSA